MWSKTYRKKSLNKRTNGFYSVIYAPSDRQGTHSEINGEINKTEISLKSNTNQKQFKAIKTEVQSNKTVAKNILQQRKFENFNNLKQAKKRNPANSSTRT